MTPPKSGKLTLQNESCLGIEFISLLLVKLQTGSRQKTNSVQDNETAWAGGSLPTFMKEKRIHRAKEPYIPFKREKKVVNWDQEDYGLMLLQPDW
eukprot:263182-Pelagomonas_calceolata.AAC.1